MNEMRLYCEILTCNKIYYKCRNTTHLRQTGASHSLGVIQVTVNHPNVSNYVISVGLGLAPYVSPYGSKIETTHAAVLRLQSLPYSFLSLSSLHTSAFPLLVVLLCLCSHPMCVSLWHVSFCSVGFFSPFWLWGSGHWTRWNRNQRSSSLICLSAYTLSFFSQGSQASESWWPLVKSSTCSVAAIFLFP